MKKFQIGLFLVLFFSLPISSHAKITSYFTPTPAIVNQLNPFHLPDQNPTPTNTAYAAVVKTLISAKKNIYMAAYEFNIYHLTQVLISKIQEGVKVFLLVEADSLKLPESRFLLETLHKAGAHIIPDLKKGGIMHNKFAVIDQEILITGSANYSINAFFQQYNDVVIVNHPKLAKEYLKRFTELTEKIYRKRRNLPSFRPQVFPDRENPDILYQVVFSRSRFDPIQIMVDSITTCKKQIYFLIFAFSSKPITQAMKECLKKKVLVKGIFDNAFESENITRNWGSIPFQILWDAGADVKYDDVIEKIHHKNIVIDDHTVITGSFNFSANAQKNNDENYLIIQSPKLASQYRSRFQKLWKEFPSTTLFEKYILARNRKQTSLSFQDYEKKAMFTRISKVKKELQGKNFGGQVVLVEDGNTVMVKLDKSQERIKVTLAGILAPIKGTHDHHQEPQSHLAKEGLIFLAAQKKVTGKVVDGEGFHIHALLYNEQKQLLNASMIEAGLVYPLWNLSDLSEGQGISTLTYQNHPLWKKELPKLRDALKLAQKEKRMLWGDHPLEMSPLEFINLLEEKELQRKLLENQHSLGKFEKKAWIGNRKTGKAYPPDSPTYMEYLKDLNDKKLIFFKSESDAKAAGYFLYNEKNH